MSSIAEAVFALDDPSPNRIGFDLSRVMRTKYIIDDFQQTYFVIDSFESLLDRCYHDFTPLYDELRVLPDIEAHAIVGGDKVITRGSMAYFAKKRAGAGQREQ
jgi:phenylalanine-4-hydroxylase